MILLDLFLTFFRIGLFSFGGGYAMLSLLQGEAVTHNWAVAENFTNFVAVSQITPGPIAINMATFVGYNQFGIVGALVATLGVSLPSFTIVLIICKFIAAFKESRILDGVFYGLRPAVAGLIGAAAVNIAIPEFFPSGFGSVEFRSLGISAAAFFIMLKWKCSPLWIIAGSAIAGLILFNF